jgi:hypothetical protein
VDLVIRVDLGLYRPGAARRAQRPTQRQGSATPMSMGLILWPARPFVDMTKRLRHGARERKNLLLKADTGNS